MTSLCRTLNSFNASQWGDLWAAIRCYDSLESTDTLVYAQIYVSKKDITRQRAILVSNPGLIIRKSRNNVSVWVSLCAFIHQTTRHVVGLTFVGLTFVELQGASQVSSVSMCLSTGVICKWLSCYKSFPPLSQIYLNPFRKDTAPAIE